MNPKDFVSTIYLGDRFCKRIIIDGYNQEVKIQVNVISRIRNDSGNWEFEKDENIEDGLIVFSKVVAIQLDTQGYIPNDIIEFISVEPATPNGEYHIFILKLVSCDNEGMYKEGTIRIEAEAIHLEDPSRLGVRITE